MANQKENVDVRKRKVDEGDVNIVHDRQEAGQNISWGSIFAGVVTFFIVLLVFGLIVAAFGLGKFTPTAGNPLAGIGTGSLIIFGIGVILALAAAGYMAGRAASRNGMIHGFLSSSLAITAAVALALSGVFGAVGVFGKVTGSVLGAAGSAAGSAADSIGKSISSNVSSLADDVQGVDTKELQNNVEDVLQDTDIKELQPDYINGLVEDTKSDLKSAGKEVLLNPENTQEVLGNVGDNIQERIDTLANAVDKDAVSNAVAENTDLTGKEADEAVDNIINSYNKAVDEASKQLEDLKTTVDETSEEFAAQWDEFKKDTDEFTDTASVATTIFVISLILGVALATYTGHLGSDVVEIEEKKNY